MNFYPFYISSLQRQPVRLILVNRSVSSWSIGPSHLGRSVPDLHAQVARLQRPCVVDIMDEAVAQFVSITDCSPHVAEQYLNLADGRLEEAMQLFLDSGGLDLHDSAPSQSRATTASGVADPDARPAAPWPPRRDAPLAPLVPREIVDVQSDEDLTDEDDRDDVTQSQPRYVGSTSTQGPRPVARSTRPGPLMDTEDDEAIARRMQEELYGGAGVDEAAGVRAPIARTRETLVGPDPNWDDDDDDVDDETRAAVHAQTAARQRRLREYAMARSERAGIFNQAVTGDAVWDEVASDPGDRRRVLAQATGGASEVSSKASMLAQMYRPPTEIMTRLPWNEAREEGKSAEKWIMVNIQDPSIFDCQLLNRDIWKDPRIRETVQENFIFMQFNKDDPRGNPYMQFYFKERDVMEAYPHIAIIDPRTGEQVKVWSGPPVPQPADFLMQLHEFLGRFSLKPYARNPMPERRKESKAFVDVERMTEEQMFEMAMQNSLAHQPGSAPDRSSPAPDRTGPVDKGKGKMTASRGVDGGHARRSRSPVLPGSNEPAIASNPVASDVAAPANSAFTSISSSRPHLEPAGDATTTTTTRIQFRHARGRIIRRFALTDPIRRLYEWLKAEPLEGKAGMEFELMCGGRNLMDQLDLTIAEAGLRNQTVMIEFLDI